MKAFQKLMMTALGIIILSQLGFAANKRNIESIKKPVTKKSIVITRKKYPEGLLTKGMEACASDIKKWCNDVIPGQGQLGRCLYSHLNDLSKSCLKFARHGGKGQEKESLIDIDRNYNIDGSSAPVHGYKK